MKTTIELPDGLYLAAKRVALKAGTLIEALIEQAPRRKLTLRRNSETPKPENPRPVGRRISWVTAKGRLPPDLDLSDREAMYSWFGKGT